MDVDTIPDTRPIHFPFELSMRIRCHFKSMNATVRPKRQCRAGPFAGVCTDIHGETQISRSEPFENKVLATGGEFRVVIVPGRFEERRHIVKSQDRRGAMVPCDGPANGSLHSTQHSHLDPFVRAGNEHTQMRGERAICRRGSRSGQAIR
jgi:hypothetical protein